MNAPTIIGAAIVFLILAAIIGRGIYNKKHHRGGCGCGCESCPSHGACHPGK